MFNLKSPKLNVTETPPQPEHIYLTRRNKIAKLAGMHFPMPAKDMLNQCLKPNVGFGAVVFIEQWLLETSACNHVSSNMHEPIVTGTPGYNFVL